MIFKENFEKTKKCTEISYFLAFKSSKVAKFKKFSKIEKN